MAQVSAVVTMLEWPSICWMTFRVWNRWVRYSGRIGRPSA
jgi:hypothetical protein